MGKRINISTGTPWEKKVGYSRVVRVGNQAFVSGTTASDADGKVQGIGDPYAQTVYILQKIEKALAEAGVSFRDVVRVRMYVTDVNSHWEAVGRGYKEFFGEILPVTSMVGISALTDPDQLVEIEIDAVIAE